jgi:hypothetical protein
VSRAAAEPHDVKRIELCIFSPCFPVLLFAPAVIQAGFSEFQKYPAEAALRHPPAKLQLDTLKAGRMSRGGESAAEFQRSVPCSALGLRHQLHRMGGRRFCYGQGMVCTRARFLVLGRR